MSPERPRWFRRKLVIGIAVTVIVLVGAAAVFALTHERAGDVSNPGVEFRAEPTSTPVPDKVPVPGKKGDPLRNFVGPAWAPRRTRRPPPPASSAPRPPFKKGWTRVAPVLLEFPPVMV